MTRHGKPPPWAAVHEATGWFLPRRVVASAATRGFAPAYVQLVCIAGPYELEVLVRHGDGAPRLGLVGQVVHADRIADPVPNLELELVEARFRRVVSVTRTNRFGEFEVSAGEEVSTFGLRIGGGADAPCVLVWGGEER